MCDGHQGAQDGPPHSRGHHHEAPGPPAPVDERTEERRDDREGCDGEQQVQEHLVIGRVRRDREEQRAGQRNRDQRVASQHRRLHQREAADRMRLVEDVVDGLPSHVPELLDLGRHGHHANVRSARPVHAYVPADRRWPACSACRAPGLLERHRAHPQAAVGGGPSPGSRGGIHCSSGRFNTMPSSNVTSSGDCTRPYSSSTDPKRRNSLLASCCRLQR